MWWNCVPHLRQAYLSARAAGASGLVVERPALVDAVLVDVAAGPAGVTAHSANRSLTEAIVVGPVVSEEPTPPAMMTAVLGAMLSAVLPAVRPAVLPAVLPLMLKLMYALMRTLMPIHR